jgi:acyl-CoA thioesterase-1
MSLRSLAVAVALLGVAGCSGQTAYCGAGQQSEVREATPSQPVTAAPTRAAAPFKIVFLGDSLTAGLGLLSEDAYPSVIGRKFAAEGYANVEIVNAGITGDTTAGAARRLADGLEPDTRILVVALGGNDALRGLTTTQTRENLATILELAQAASVRVLLAGMEAPTNLGEDYQTAFRSVFIQLAREYRANVVYMPFLLEGVAAVPTLNQADGIHPNKEGARIIAENMYPKLRTLVDELGGGG